MNLNIITVLPLQFRNADLSQYLVSLAQGKSPSHFQQYLIKVNFN